MLLLPDRHDLLQAVDEPVAGLERLRAMARATPRSPTLASPTGTTPIRCTIATRAERPRASRRGREAPHLLRRHAPRTPRTRAASRAGRRSRCASCRRRSRRRPAPGSRDRRSSARPRSIGAVGDLEHAQRTPLTGGKNATSSPSASAMDRLDVALVDREPHAHARAPRGARRRATPTARPTVVPRAHVALDARARAARAASRRTAAGRGIAQPRTSCTMWPSSGTQQLRHRELDGRGRARQRDDDRTARDAGDGPRQHRRRADLARTRAMRKSSPKPSSRFSSSAGDRLVGGVARREPGAAVHDDRVDVGIGEPVRRPAADTRAGSSGRIACATTVCPPCTSRSRKRARSCRSRACACRSR